MNSKTLLMHLIRDSRQDHMPRRFQNGKLLVRGKRPYWYLKVTVPVITADGPKKRRVEKVLGFCDEMKRREAEAIRHQILEAVNNQKLMASVQVKFKDLAERYQKTELPLLGVGGRLKNESVIRVHLLPAFGEKRLAEIDTPTIQEWLNTKSGYSWETIHSLKGILSVMFTAAERWEMFEGKNPTRGVRIGKKKLKREKRLLTAEQVQAILAALEARERFIVTILFGLGLRVSECLGLKWKDIDFDRARLAVCRRWYRGDLQEETKSEASARVLALGSLIEEFRKRYPGPQALDKFVFADPENPPDDRELLRWKFRPVVKALGLYYEGFGWHTFRRQNVTWRQSLGGASPLEAMRAAGHSSVDMTLLYTLTDHERQADQVTKLLDALCGKPEGATMQ